MKPPKPQLSRIIEPDRLDTAIDQVTARLVQVREDEDLALRIASALPQRSSRFGWLMPQFAALAAFAIAAVVWTTRDAATPSLLPSSNIAAVSVVANKVMAVEPGTMFRTQPLEPLEPLEPWEPLEPLEPLADDFDRSLAPIEAMRALVMTDVAPDQLPATSALVLAPITITELPLTADSFRRDE